MPFELIWIGAVLAIGASILASALYAEAVAQYRRRFAKSSVLSERNS
jgi:hypothetical protein